MSCDSKGLPIKLRGDGPPIGVLVRERRLAAFRVTYDRHLFYDCGKLHNGSDKHSWTLDTETMLFYRRGFSIMEFHVIRMGVEIPFRIAADTFARGGHSSFDCDDRKRERPEKWHCPWRLFQVNEDVLRRYPPPPRPRQEALL